MEKRCSLPIPFGWYGVAFSADLQPGDVKPIHYLEQEMVLFRTESGEAKVIDAYCSHLGAHLGHGGSVKGEYIACPFHGWEFDGGGVCQHIPYAKRIPPKVEGKETVHSYPTVEKNNTIWIWYHPDGLAPQFDVEEIEEIGRDDWTDFYHYDWTVDVHLQEAAENAADAAHFLYVHGAQEVPQGVVTHEGHRRNAQYTSRRPDMDEHGNFDQTGTKWRDSQLQTSNCGPGQAWQRFSGFIDTLMLGVVTPITANQLHIRFAFTQPKGLNEMEQVMAQALMDEISRQVEQDIPIWNHKIYKAEPNLCDGDGPIFQFRKWFGQFYAE